MKNLLNNINSWKEFKSSLHTLSNKEKGDAFELLTKYYLQLDPTYKSLISNVWIHHEVPNPIRKKLNLPPQDMGIDIIAETKSGEYWAVQCKYREDESNALTWTEVSTFVGLANTKCKHISHCIIATSKDRLVKVLDDVNLGLLAGDTWRNLDQEFFSKLHLVVKSKPVRIKPLKPYSHKKRAIKNAYKHFITNKQSRGKLIMPCGTGKTLTAFWIAEKLGAKTIVIAVPSLSLIRQTLKVWLREVVAKNIDAEWICVCSDQKAGTWKRDELQYLNQDLGVPALTDTEYIAKWLRKRRKGLSVVFTTYQSGKVLSQAAKTAKRVFDLGIMDEAHKTVGSKDKKFAHLLFDENIKIKKRCFMTATERRYLGTKDDIISMDDMDIYGETFELLSFKEAIEQSPPILTDYKIITIGVGRDHIEDLIRKNVLVKPDKGKWNKKMEAEMLASLIALRKAMRGRNIKHALSFHSSIAKAKVFADNQENFTKAFPEYWNVDAFHVHGKMNTSERDRIIKDEFLESKRALMTNARCLTEGVDIPDIDCILFADPKKSTIDIVQAVGRALRLTKDKKFGYVIVPVILEKEKDFKKTEAYQSILMVLRALAANDDRIIDYFRATTNKERTGTPVEIEVDEKLAELIDTNEFTKTIELNIWGRLARLSWRPFEEARNFIQSYTFKTKSEWATYCRSGYKPLDIPNKPETIYKGKGWQGYGDWLGTGNIANFDRIFKPFQEARKFSHSLKLKSQTEWIKYCKGEFLHLPEKPIDIPYNPGRTYIHDGYKGMGDWLGTGKPQKLHSNEYRTYEEAREFVRSLNLKSLLEWKKYCRGEISNIEGKPRDIPSKPASFYKNKGWIGIHDWLGIRQHSRLIKKRSFKEARKFVHTLLLESENEWREYCKGNLTNLEKKPIDIPMSPGTVYKNDGWKGLGDWLGTGTIAPYNREYLSYIKARAYVHTLNLDNVKSWTKYCKDELNDKPPLPPNIPASPIKVYQNDWVSWTDWLGTDNIATHLIDYLPFTKARKFAHSLNLKKQTEWMDYIHHNPNKLIPLPKNIPRTPNQVYNKSGWISWSDWLNTSRFVKGSAMPFIEAREFVRKLELQSIKEWKEYCQGSKKPITIPMNPRGVYRDDGWISMSDWLGKKPVSKEIQKRTFKSARKFVHSLNLKSTTEWRKYCKGEFSDKPQKPSDIPNHPRQTYSNDWISMGDWLGTGSISPQNYKYTSFSEARAFARKLKLKTGKEWVQYTRGQLNNKPKIPPNIPTKPERTYKDTGWINIADWLGNKPHPRSVNYLSFIVARNFVHALKLKSQREWTDYCKGELKNKKKKPLNIPTRPRRVYKNKGFISMGDWLGTNTIAPQKMKYRSFKDARAFAQSLNLKSLNEWKKYCKDEIKNLKTKPSDIPTDVYAVYKRKGDWTNYSDFLGYEIKKKEKT